MITDLAAVALAALALTQPPDTVVAVRAGDRLTVQNHAGSITVRAWERPEVRVSAGPGREGEVRVSRSGSTLAVHGRHHGDDEALHLSLSVPADVALRLHGPFSEIDVQGMREQVRAESVEGSIRIRGGSGLVSVHTVEGDVVIEDARGVVRANTVDGEVRITGVTGDVTADAIDGGVRLERIDSRNVSASTVDGDLVFDGALHDGGVYRLSTHDGDVVLRVPERSNATVSVATYDGDFVSSFPVALQGSREGRRFEFTLGNGSARVELQSFDGEIRLLRPGEGIPEER